MYVITVGIKRNDFFMQRNASPINHTISWYLCLTLWLCAKALRFIIRFLKQKSFQFTKLCTTQLVCGTHQIKWLMSATHQLWVKYTVDLFHIYIYIRICSFSCLISQLPLVTDHYLFVCLFFSRQNSTANLCETLAIESEKITNLLSILIFMFRLNWAGKVHLPKKFVTRTWNVLTQVASSILQILSFRQLIICVVDKLFLHSLNGQFDYAK